jgi:hypothetical protein
MRAHIAAIEALLAPLGYETYYVDVPETPTIPYVLLWSSNGTTTEERPIGYPAPADDDLTDLLGVTCVAGTAYGVLTLRAAVRGVLNDSRPAVPGRYAELHLFDSQNTQVDRDVTPHVPYGVDLYRLTSVPA